MNVWADLPKSLTLDARNGGGGGGGVCVFGQKCLAYPQYLLLGHRSTSRCQEKFNGCIQTDTQTDTQ